MGLNTLSIVKKNKRLDKDKGSEGASALSSNVPGLRICESDARDRSRRPVSAGLLRQVRCAISSYAKTADAVGSLRCNEERKRMRPSAACTLVSAGDSLRKLLVSIRHECDNARAPRRDRKERPVAG